MWDENRRRKEVGEEWNTQKLMVLCGFDCLVFVLLLFFTFKIPPLFIQPHNLLKTNPKQRIQIRKQCIPVL